MTATPATQKVRAIDVRPYHWAIWCTVAGSVPFENEIVGRKWSADGQTIWFMLDSHNFHEARPEDEMELVPVTVPYASKARDAEDAAFLASRPTPKTPCPTCGAMR